MVSSTYSHASNRLECECLLLDQLKHCFLLKYLQQSWWFGGGTEKRYQQP